MEDKSLENDNLIDLLDTEGFTFAILVSRFEDEDWIMVGTSVLMPRAGDIIMMDGEGRGRAEIFQVQGTVSVRFQSDTQSLHYLDCRNRLCAACKIT